MKATLLTVVLALCPAFIYAETSLPLIRPEATRGLIVRKLERSQGLFAEFEGTLAVSGTFIAQWIQGVDEDTDNTLDLRLVPDPETIARIPYFDRYPVRKIDIENEAEALRLVIQAKTLARLQKKEIKVVRATGTFVLRNYVVGVECDASWARAKIVSAKIPRPLMLTGTPQPFGC